MNLKNPTLKAYMNKIIIISGPTATGKTSTSINLARKLDAEIINFDSLVFYKEINIGTAKPTKAEQSGIKHHLVGTHSIFNPINAADFVLLAEPLINQCHKEGKVVILVGGSGFYLQAILNGMYDSVTTPLSITQKSDHLYEKEGISPFISLLKENDPISFDRYHENDHYRIRRAVEHFWTTNIPFSKAREEMQKKLKDSPVKRNGWDVLHIHLDLPKELHFEIIQKRTKEMLENGLINEVKELLSQEATGEEKPLKSIGYKETIQYINGEFEDIASLSERISINTRRLAKSQRTWFNKINKYTYNPLEDFDKIIDKCNQFVKSEIKDGN